MKTTRYFLLICSILLSTQLFAQDVDDLMEMSLDDLLNMEVTTASKSAEKLSDAPGVISVVTQEELQRFGGQTLKEILERVPGLSPAAGWFTDPSLVAARGDQLKSNAGHNLILVNGRPMREVNEGGISSETFESFPINIIEKIEVIKGPGSVLYGSNAFSTVINIITESAEKNSLNVSGLASHGGTYGSFANAKLKQGDLQVVAAGRYYKKADWETNTLSFDFLTGEIVNSPLTLKNTGQSGYLGAHYKNLQIMSNYNRLQTTAGFGNIKWQKAFVDLGYDMQVKPDWSMDFNVTYANSKFDAATILAGTILRNSGDFVAEWANSVTSIEKVNIIAGGLVNYVHGKEDEVAAGVKSNVADIGRTSFAVYSQADYRPVESLKLITGFQANKVKNLDWDIVPRGGAIWYAHPRINIKALYSQAFRAPSVNEFGLEHPALRGNAALKPEKVATIDFGLNYLGENTQIGVNYFHSKQANIINTVFDLTTFISQYVNQGEVTIQGVEFEGKYYVSREILLVGSMLYQVSEDAAGTKNVSTIPDFGAKAGVSYMGQNGLTVSLFNIYQGALVDKYENLFNQPTGAYNMLTFHSRVDLNKVLDLQLKQKLAVVLEARNVLNREIWIPSASGYGVDGTPADEGRSIIMGLDVSL